MDNNIADNTAKQMMKEAHNGENISRQYNNLSLQEQRDVFTSMRNLSSHGAFPDLQITGTDDGTLGDMQRTKTTLERLGQAFLGDKTQDVYDTPKDQQAKIEAQNKSTVSFVENGGIGVGGAQDVAKKLEHRGDTIAKALGE